MKTVKKEIENRREQRKVFMELDLNMSEYGPNTLLEDIGLKFFVKRVVCEQYFVDDNTNK